MPPPFNCPECRLRLRTAHRNEQHLYRRPSAHSDQPLISIYAPDTLWGQRLKIFSYDEWWSDSWDAMSFGRKFDFTRPFFPQFHELLLDVPLVALMQLNNDNSPFTTGTGYCRNCYLINCSENCQDCYYGKLLQSCRDVTDSSFAYDSELLYGCFNVKKCYNCVFLSYSQNCSDCVFSENLNSCRNCFLSTNLSNKEYYFMNKPLSKEEYRKQVDAFLGSHANFQKARTILDGLRRSRIHKYSNIINSENCSGDFISNCKNCIDCYDINDSQDCKYVTVGVECKDVMDCSNMYIKPELCYEVLGTITVYNCIFCIYVFHSQNLMYSQFCYNSKNLFGCVGLRNKEYCIFNRQFSPDEYEDCVPRMIEHMRAANEFGRFFPHYLSPFGYNETVAYDYVPLTREEARERGLKWRDPVTTEYAKATFTLPDAIADVGDEVLRATLVCEKCGRNFRIISQELRQLRSMRIPAPRACPDCRHRDRMGLRNMRRLWDRTCARCAVALKSTFSPKQPDVIFCESCYTREIF